MGEGSRRALLLCAGGLLVGAANPRYARAAEAVVISPATVSQASPGSLRPSTAGQASLAPLEVEQPVNESEPPGLKEYLQANDEISLLGMRLRLEQREGIQGLLIVDIAAGSPAAQAGLHPFRQPVRTFINGMSMLAAMAFPPAVVVAPMIGSIPLNETYDLIIGVDGSRVGDFMELYYHVRDVRPGEIVYLNVLHNGDRVQVPVRVTSALPPPQSWAR